MRTLLPKLAVLLLASSPARAETPSSLKVTPASITLDGPRDARRVLVTGVTAKGETYDLSPKATYAIAEGLTIDRNGFFRASKDGQFVVKVSAEGQSVELPITAKNTANPTPVSFVRDVMPSLSRLGCNAGTCHGSAKGKKGFKLSLRGYDPDFDYAQLVDDLAGRRFNRSAPEQSLMLLKPTTMVPHEGGNVLEPGTPPYALLHDWISQGVNTDFGQVTRAASLEVLPPVIDLAREGGSQQMLVIAHYSDGQTRDVTGDAVFTSSVPDVATVTAAGMVTAVRRGEASILVRYEGVYGVDNVTVMGDRDGYEWKPRPSNNYIDELVYKKLQKVKILPSETCSDEEFLRRASIDLTGLPPSPENVRAFLADPTESNEKRNRAIDAMIDSPEFVTHWTHKWADLFQANRKLLGDKATWAFDRWIENAVSRNIPYDRMVRELMTAIGGASENPAVNYFRAQKEPTVAMENATQLFLGTRFSCNKCHDHPFERWTQNQYYGLAAFWGQTGTKPSMQGEIVYERGAGEVTHIKDKRVMPPSFPFEHNGKIDKSANRREQLAEWLTAPENPYFARSVANRVWSYFLGRGIIDPVDDIRSSNPASNPDLLDALEKDFVAQGFDLRHLMRTIARSRTYQASIVTNDFNKDDTINFSHATPRRLTAEQLLDAIDQAAGRKPRFPGVPAGFRANQLPDSQVGGTFLDLFGRPPRESPCECERSSEVSLSQALNLVNGPTISEAIIDPNGRIHTLLKKNPTDEAIVEEMYLAALSRLPKPDEMRKAKTYLAETTSKAEGAQDLLWALINSPSFLFNR